MESSSFALATQRLWANARRLQRSSPSSSQRGPASTVAVASLRSALSKSRPKPAAWTDSRVASPIGARCSAEATAATPKPEPSLARRGVETIGSAVGQKGRVEADDPAPPSLQRRQELARLGGRDGGERVGERLAQLELGGAIEAALEVRAAQLEARLGVLRRICEARQQRLFLRRFCGDGRARRGARQACRQDDRADHETPPCQRASLGPERGGLKHGRLPGRIPNGAGSGHSRGSEQAAGSAT